MRLSFCRLKRPRQIRRQPELPAGTLPGQYHSIQEPDLRKNDMMSDQETHSGILLDDSVEFTLSVICRTCHVHAELVIELVEVGVLEPRGRQPEQWRFSGQALQRLERAMTLQRDLEVNLAGAALALDLLDEIDRLRERLRILERDRVL